MGDFLQEYFNWMICQLGRLSLYCLAPNAMRNWLWSISAKTYLIPRESKLSYPTNKYTYQDPLVAVNYLILSLILGFQHVTIFFSDAIHVSSRRLAIKAYRD